MLIGRIRHRGNKVSLSPVELKVAPAVVRLLEPQAVLHRCVHQGRQSVEAKDGDAQVVKLQHLERAVRNSVPHTVCDNDVFFTLAYSLGNRLEGKLRLPLHRIVVKCKVLRRMCKNLDQVQTVSLGALVLRETLHDRHKLLGVATTACKQEIVDFEVVLLAVVPLVLAVLDNPEISISFLHLSGAVCVNEFVTSLGRVLKNNLNEYNQARRK